MAATQPKGRRGRRGTAPELDSASQEALHRRIAELEEQVRQAQLQQPAPDLGTKKPRKLVSGPSFYFDGSRDETKVLAWLCKVDIQIRKNEKMRGESIDEDEKLIIVEEHMEDTPLRQYHLKIQQDGEFGTYEEFVEWMRAFYIPLDSLAANRMTYENCKQRDNERVDDYYTRFLDAVARMDETPKVSLQVSKFVFGLHEGYQRMLSQYPDMSTFKNVTMEMVFERINRGRRMGHDSVGKPASNSQQTNNGKSPERRISNNSKPKFKDQSKRGRFKSESKSLTEEQKRRAELLIKRGKGEFVGLDLYDNANWWEMARGEDVCARCAKGGHIAKDCSLPNPRPKKKNGKNQLNTIRASAISGMDIDYDYFCSLSEGTTPLAMFPCIIRSKRGIALLDTGATRNYISRAYAK